MVLAIVVLAALLLMGLPFLFSQSASLGGARATADREIAQGGRGTAESAATAAGIVAMTDLVAVDGTTDAGDVIRRLHDQGLVAPLNPNATDLYPDNVAALTAAGPATGAWISDESGKLDPNSLTTQGWHRLLIAANILDWDDSGQLNTAGAAPVPMIVTSEYTTDGSGRHHQARDGDAWGELAEALAYLRNILPGRRITRLEQLLEAKPGSFSPNDPGDWSDAYPGYSYNDPTGNSTPPPGKFGLRRPLTRAELERLRPHLTLWTPRPGRNGYLDAGNHLYTHVPANNTTWSFRLDSDLQLAKVFADGTRLVRADGAGWHRTDAEVTGVTASQSTYWVRQDRSWLPGSGGYGDAIAMEIASPINMNAASELLWRMFGLNRSASAASLPLLDGTAMQTITGTSGRLLDLADPLWNNYELPPLGIVPNGIIRIESFGVARDARERSTTHAGRSTVVQALPQESIIERRWSTQGQYHRVVAQRQASNMLAWPNGYQRTTDLAPDDTTGTAGTGMQAQPLPTLATGTQLPPQAQALPNFYGQFDAYLGLGRRQAEALATLLTGQNANTPSPLAPGTAVTPEGLRIDQTMAWPLRRDNTGLILPWGTNPGESEIRPRHLGLWIQPQASWKGPGRRCILESRLDGSVANLLAPRADGTPDDPERQNYLGLFHETLASGQQQFVVVIAPPSVDHIADYRDAGGNRITARSDDRATFGVNELSLSDGTNGKPLAGARDSGLASIKNAISDLYEPGRTVLVWTLDRAYTDERRWINLHLLLADGSEDGIHLIVDGHAGQDVLRSGRDQTVDHGDYIRFPAWPLKTALPELDAPDTNALLTPGTIQVGTINGVGPDAVLPIRGQVRIDDEYLGYDQLSSTSLMNISRGERQNTQTDSGTQRYRYPQLQQHRSANSPAIVVPAGMRLRFGANSRIYRGGATLPDGFPAGDDAATRFISGTNNSPTTPPIENPNVRQHQIWGRLDPDALMPSQGFGVNYRRFDPFGTGATGTLTITNRWGPARAMQWPSTGIICVTDARLNVVHYLRYGSVTGTGNVTFSDLSRVIPTGDGYAEVMPNPSLIPAESYPNNNPYPTPAVQYACGAIDDVGLGLPPAVNADGITYTWQLPSVVHLVGIPMTLDSGSFADIRNNRLFKVGIFPDAPTQLREGNFTYPYFLMQIRDLDGAVEWVNYHQFVSSNGSIYLVNRTGWGHWTDLTNNNRQVPSRGTHRTANRSDTAYWSNFKPGSSLLPVQTDLGAPGHLLATGDVIAVQPQDWTKHAGNTPAAAGAFRPWTPVVRFAATDGYATTDDHPGRANAAFDSKNEYVAFDQKIDFDMQLGDANDYDWMIGLGWNGANLTKQGPATVPKGSLPRIDLWMTNPDPNDPANPQRKMGRLVIGGPDTILGGLEAHRPENGLAIDGVVAGDIPGRRANDTDLQARITAVIDGGAASDFLPAGNLPGLPNGTLVVQADSPLFSGPLGSGLVRIDGEVFAFRRVSDDGRNAILFGRGLLDGVSTTPRHIVRDGPSSQVYAGLRTIRIPVGQVGLAPQNVSAHLPQAWTTWNTPPYRSNTPPEPIDPASPALMLVSADGNHEKTELMTAPARAPIRSGPYATKGGLITADWLRGQYGTTLGAAGANALWIGWWPRYPSALPPSAAAVPQHFRSRTFAWAGFPMAVFGGRMDLVNGSNATIPLDLPSDSQALFTAEARAMSAGHDWTAAPSTALAWGSDNKVTVGSGTLPSDGTEVRVTFHYVTNPPAASLPSDPLAAAAVRANTAPRIGPVRLRTMAPTRILATEGTR